MTPILWTLLGSICILVCVIIFLIVWGVRKSRTGRAGKTCDDESDCTVGQTCSIGQCVAPVTGFCIFDDQCVSGATCIDGVCTHDAIHALAAPTEYPGPSAAAAPPEDDDFTQTPGPVLFQRRRRRFSVRIDGAHKRPRVENASIGKLFEVLEGDIRSEFARKIEAAKAQAHVDTLGPPALEEDPFGIPIDLLAPITTSDADTTRAVHRGVQLPRAVVGTNTIALLPPQADRDIASMAIRPRESYYLLADTGDLIVSSNADDQVQYLPTDRHLERIAAHGRGLVGVSEGVLYQSDDLDGKLPDVLHWEEAANIPTRQIIHVGSSGDHTSLVIQDNSHMYILDSTLRVVHDKATTDTRYLGHTRDVFADVGQDGLMVTHNNKQHAGVAAVAFLDDDNPVALSLKERMNGVSEILSYDGKLFYLSR